MSYAWELGDRALIQLRALDVWLQEETLDFIDTIASSPNPTEHPSATTSSCMISSASEAARDFTFF